MLTPAQSRAGRALLNWSQPQLAEASGTSVSTIRDFETGKRSPIANNLAAIQAALEAAGVEFTNGGQPGVKLRMLTWWTLHLTPRGWVKGSADLGHGRASPDDKPPDAVLTIRQEIHGTGQEPSPSLVGEIVDLISAERLLLQFPTLLDKSPAPRLSELKGEGAA